MVAVRDTSPELYWLRVDANSNLLTLTPPGRPAHSFTYDSRDLTEQYTPPAATPGGPTGYAYNADAQPVSTTRPDGDVITGGYDLAGRLQTLSIPRGSFGYGYDSGTGKLSSVTGPDGFSRTYAYQGGLLSSLTSGGPVSGSAAWTYDNNFRTTGRTVNGGNGIAFGYDADDLSTAVGSLTMARDAQNGLLAGTTLGSVTDSLVYSTFGEVSGYAASAGAGQLYSESYVRDNLGRITQRTEVLQGVTTVWGYGYDLSGRLVTVTRNGAAFESYTFDSNDNRLTKTTLAGTTTYAYDDQDRLLSAVGPGGAESWIYDGHGDLLSHNGSAGQTSFDYETGGQLLSVTKPGGDVVSYELDAGNKRAVKRVNGVVQRQWLYAGGLLPVAELDASGNLVAVFNGGFMVKNGTTYRLLRDHLGSVRMVVDANNGTVVQRLSYDAWGTVLEDTNPGFQPFGYAGGLYDPDTGLVRFGARDYEASAARWTCKDPICLAAGANLYSYCFGDPVNLADMTGFEPEERWDPHAWRITEPGEQAKYNAYRAEVSGQVLMELGLIVAGGPALKGVVWLNRLRQFSKIERGIIKSTRSIRCSKELRSLRTAHEAGRPASATIKGKTILYEPDLPAEGLSLFGENGFVLGPKAFLSEESLTKTILHESHRLSTSQALQKGVSAELAASETSATEQFVNRAIRMFHP